MSNLWGRLARLRVDVGPLRDSRDFRLLFFAGTVFYLGGMVSYVALPYQLYQLTGSNFAVGALGIVELVPLVVFGLYGGALADHVDRRLMLVVTGAAQVLLTAALMANAFLSAPRLWVIYVLGAVLAAASSLQRPSREALLPRVVRHQQIPAAIALSSLGREISGLVGPALGGLLLQWVGIGWCFALDVTGLTVATALFLALKPYPATDRSNPPSLSGVAEGLRYAMGRKDLLGTYVIDIVAMFMAMPIVLFPALATMVFHAPAMLGLLYSAEGVGALLATATSGWISHVHHHGRAIVIAASAWGASIALAGLMPSLWLVLACLVGAGAADMLSGLFRSVIWNQTIPDSIRGRLAGIGPNGGPDPGRVRSRPMERAWVDHQWRHPLRRGRGADRLVAAWLLGL